MKLNEKLLLEIKRQGLGQYEVARKAGISENTLSKILRGHVEPAYHIKYRIARALQKPIKELFDDTTIQIRD